MRAKGRFGYYLSYHLRQSKIYYFLLGFCLVVGIALGVVLQFTSRLGGYLLSDKDQQVFDFVTHDGSILKFFYSKALNELFAFGIIFVCGLSVYSSFLIGLFFAYQGIIFGASCCQIIALYKLMGIVNVFVLLVPINAILFLIMLYFSVVCVRRAATAKRYNIRFKSSFSFERYFWREITISAVISVIFVLAVSVLYSIVLRSVSFVAF